MGAAQRHPCTQPHTAARSCTLPAERNRPMSIDKILYILALIAFIGAAIGFQIRKISLIAVGLALLTLTRLI
jgi:hypothetical protein